MAAVASLAALTAARAVPSEEKRDLEAEIAAKIPRAANAIVDTSGAMPVDMVTRQTGAASMFTATSEI